MIILLVTTPIGGFSTKSPVPYFQLHVETPIRIW
jgi:hypothetical protein